MAAFAHRLSMATAVATAVLLLTTFAGAMVVAGGGCHPKAGTLSSEGSGALVTIEACAFGPTVLTVEPGTVVTWLNSDRAPHAVTGIGWGTSESFDPGERISHRFDTPGTHPYQCYLHPGMAGAIVVEAAGTGSTVAAGLVQTVPTEATEGGGSWLPTVASIVLVGSLALTAGFVLGRVAARATNGR